MANKKNQHFVPKCYLKPFSKDGDGSAINLYNIDRKQAIQNVSVKGQCSKSYFYGEDLKIENALSSTESMYGTVINKLQSGIPLNSNDRYVLKAFAFLQHFRTEQNIEMLKMQHKGFVDAILQGPESSTAIPEMTHKDFVIQAISIFATSLHLIDDLDCFICDNKDRSQFITSDDPVTLTNKFSHQKLKQDTFGLASSGVLYFLPLTPRYLLVIYDPNIYFISTSSYFIDVGGKDIEALNELQYIRANKNIYFSEWGLSKNIQIKLESYRINRPAKWSKTEIFVRDTSLSDSSNSHYKSASPLEIKESLDSLISLRPIHLYPSRWLSVLKYRMRPITFTNGSSVGYVRPAVARRRMLGAED